MRVQVIDKRTLTDTYPDVRDMEFRTPPVSVGSHSENLLQLPDINIAPFYATIDIVADNWTFQPSLRDGVVKLNGKPVLEPVELHNGDELDITYFTIKITIDEEMVVAVPDAPATGELAKIRQYPLPPRSIVRKPDEDLRLNAARQRALADIAHHLRRCADYASLLEKTVQLLLAEMNGRMAWMGVRRQSHGPIEFMDGLSDAGKYVGEPLKFETYEYRCLARHQFIVIPRTGDGETQSVIALPILVPRGAIGLLYIDTRRHTRVFDDADLDFVTLVARLIAPVLESIIAQTGEPKREIAAGGLAAIRDMQAKLDPRSLPEWPELPFSAFSKAGADSAGDMYDIMKMPNGLAAFLVAHVIADPTRTALAMAQLRGAFRIAGLHADPPRVQLKAMNWLLFDEKDPCRTDAAILVANPKTGAAEVATAGRIAALLIDAQGKPRSLTNPEALPIGSLKNFEFAGSTVRLQPGDTLALYTSGCATATNQAGQQLGGAKFADALCDGFGQPPSAMLEDLLRDLAAFLKEGRCPDDVTILLAQRTS